MAGDRGFLRYLVLFPLMFVWFVFGVWWPILVGASLVLAQIIFQVWWEEADNIPDWMESVAEWMDDRMETFMDWLD